MDIAKIKDYFPYIVSVSCSIIAGLTSYAVARKQAKADLQRIEKQHALDIDKEREKFAMEREKMEISHRYQLELLQKQTENELGASLTNTFISEAMKTPEVRQMLSKGIKHK
jgi:cellobiose-specific phosphotransferase system component IIA